MDESILDFRPSDILTKLSLLYSKSIRSLRGHIVIITKYFRNITEVFFDKFI